MLPIITLLTDFGSQDGYAAVMKGVILSINPKVTIVDISHDIPQWDLKSAAFVLQSAYAHFPKETIHVVVIDPGVGSERDILAVQTPDYTLLAPDNGVLSVMYRNEQECEIYQINTDHEKLFPASQTFHGRDVFAPIAAHLSAGSQVSNFGEIVETPVMELIEDPVVNPSHIAGSIVYQDRFGNLITNISGNDLKTAGLTSSCMAVLNGKTINGLQNLYASVPQGSPLMLISSAGFLEIACNAGSASEYFARGTGTPIKLLEE